MKFRLHTWLILAALAAMIGLLFSPPPVSAHAYVVSSTPAADETLAESPDEVTVDFNEPVEEGFHALTVTGPGGERVEAGNSKIDPERPTRLSVALSTDLADGVYAANWKIVSGDGHPVSGTISFQIGQGGAGQDAAPKEIAARETDFPGWDLLAVRWLFYGGMAAYIGTILFHLVLLPGRGLPGKGRLGRRSRTALLAGYAAASAGVLLSLLQQTAADAGSGWSKAWDPYSLGVTLKYTSFGEVWKGQAVLMAVLLGFTLLLLRSGSPSQKRAAENGGFGRADRKPTGLLLLGAAFLCSLGLLLAKAKIGHAATASLQSIAVAADFLHLAAALIWLGGVGALAFLLPAANQANSAEGVASGTLTRQAVRRFSAVAAGSVALLLATGIYGSLLHVPTWYALSHTDYGRVLLAKVGLTLVCMALGLSAFLRGRKPESHPLGPGVWAELGVGLIVLVLAALLANLPTAAADPGPAQLAWSLPDGSRIVVDITPNRVGTNAFQASVVGSDGQPRNDIEQVTLELTSKEMDMGRIEVTLPGGGSPQPAEELVTMSGRWNVHVHILFKSLDAWDHDFEINVGG
ncbi:copper resistance CopC/CopD family protein [Paenibacillus macerans]|uniref:copper resistance CopC/CopD family protein n=1 Tax=Paenibacillus macerans TaxID=44252 RepID=UPI003D31B809